MVTSDQQRSQHARRKCRGQELEQVGRDFHKLPMLASQGYKDSRLFARRTERKARAAAAVAESKTKAFHNSMSVVTIGEKMVGLSGEILQHTPVPTEMAVTVAIPPPTKVSQSPQVFRFDNLITASLSTPEWSEKMPASPTVASFSTGKSPWLRVQSLPVDSTVSPHHAAPPSSPLLVTKSVSPTSHRPNQLVRLSRSLMLLGSLQLCTMVSSIDISQNASTLIRPLPCTISESNSLDNAQSLYSKLDPDDAVTANSEDVGDSITAEDDGEPKTLSTLLVAAPTRQLHITALDSVAAGRSWRKLKDGTLQLKEWTLAVAMTVIVIIPLTVHTFLKSSV